MGHAGQGQQPPIVLVRQGRRLCHRDSLSGCCCGGVRRSQWGQGSLAPLPTLSFSFFFCEMSVGGPALPTVTLLGFESAWVGLCRLGGSPVCTGYFGLGWGGDPGCQEEQGSRGEPQTASSWLVWALRGTGREGVTGLSQVPAVSPRDSRRHALRHWPPRGWKPVSQAETRRSLNCPHSPRGKARWHPKEAQPLAEPCSAPAFSRVAANGILFSVLPWTGPPPSLGLRGGDVPVLLAPGCLPDNTPPPPCPMPCSRVPSTCSVCVCTSLTQPPPGIFSPYP